MAAKERDLNDVGPDRADPDAIAWAWTQAIADTSYVPLGRADIQAYLRGLSNRLVETLSAPDFDIGTAQAIGESLVATHFTRPRSLAGTLTVLGDRLAPLSSGGRLSRVLAALAAGYASALRDRTLAEQEGILNAAMAAREQAEKARSASEARFAALFADAAIGIAITTIDGETLDVNRAMCEMFGYSADELRRKQVQDLAHPDHLAAMREKFAQVVAGQCNQYRMEAQFYRRDGTALWTDLVVSVIHDPAGGPQYVVTMAEDVSERYALHARLRHQALHDPLTELPNRTLFFERLSQALSTPAAGARVGLCYLDLDGFKAVNDTLGHDVGDQLLRTIAGRLADQLAPEGHLVARMGGDEFVILAVNSHGTEQLVGVAKSALAVLRAPVHLAGNSLRVSASIGVVEREASDTTVAELMKAADTTLYWAKSDGRNRYALFDAQRHAREITRFTLSAALPSGLERGEFVVEYQPLVRLFDGQMIGVEALVRWNHPELGRLGPDRFIGPAEETGAIVALGSWVLRTACQQARVWQDRFPGTNLVMSVNLAARQADDPEIADQVATILSDTGLDAGRLQLELTESAVTGTDGQPLKTLQELSDLGVRIAIDDFGTGYSNLVRLRSLPVHGLKLAGSIISPSRTEPVDREVVTAVVGLAHALRLSVTAEEVASPQQAVMLRELGCDLAQGFYYEKAVPPDHIEDILRAGGCML